MGEVIDLSKIKANQQGGTMERKKPTARQLSDRIDLLENIVAQTQQALGSLSQELFHINANNVALFRAIEAKGVITEDDIRDSWEKHIKNPYEEDIAKAKAQATSSETGQDLQADSEEDTSQASSEKEEDSTKEDTETEAKQP